MFYRTCIVCGDVKEVKSRQATNRKYCSSCKYKSEDRSKKISEQKSGEKHQFFGKKLTKNHKDKISTGNRGKLVSNETRRKISASRTGRIASTRKGIKLSEETKTKIRLGGIEAYKRKHAVNIPSPRINPTACKLFGEIESKFGLDGIYFSKSGYEFFIKELGYWVDYYEPNLNLVIEFYERHHNKPDRRLKDFTRMNLIKDQLGCKFIVVWEFDTKEEVYEIVHKHIHNQ